MTFGENRKALRFGQQKMNLHEVGREYNLKALRPTPGSADLCFIVSVPVQDVAKQIRAAGVDVLEGPVDRTGAIGRIRSVYLRDPDGNLIELSNYLV